MLYHKTVNSYFLCLIWIVSSIEFHFFFTIWCCWFGDISTGIVPTIHHFCWHTLTERCLKYVYTEYVHVYIYIYIYTYVAPYNPLLEPLQWRHVGGMMYQFNWSLFRRTVHKKHQSATFQRFWVGNPRLTSGLPSQRQALRKWFPYAYVIIAQEYSYMRKP